MFKRGAEIVHLADGTWSLNINFIVISIFGIALELVTLWIAHLGISGLLLSHIGLHKTLILFCKGMVGKLGKQLWPRVVYRWQGSGTLSSCTTERFVIGSRYR